MVEFRHFAIFISLLFSLVGVGESQKAEELVAGEDYWQAVWPNTPIPTALRDLLKPEDVEMDDDVPMAIDGTQYPKTFFFEHDLYPPARASTLKLQFSNSPFAQPYGLLVASKVVKDVEKEGYTMEELCMKKSPSKGEHKYCAKSLGALVGFAISKLGKNIEALSSSFNLWRNKSSTG